MESTRPVREKHHRLPAEHYFGRVMVSYTLCIHERRRPFTESSCVEECIRVLELCVPGKGCVALIYTFMPDHAHIVLSGLEETSRPNHAIAAFKQATGFWFSRNMPHVRWQKDYYDHILRDYEGARSHVWYVLGNPVRAGLVEEALAFPFTGSIGCDLQTVLSEHY